MKGVEPSKRDKDERKWEIRYREILGDFFFLVIMSAFSNPGTAIVNEKVDCWEIFPTTWEINTICGANKNPTKIANKFLFVMHVMNNKPVIVYFLYTIWRFHNLENVVRWYTN